MYTYINEEEDFLLGVPVFLLYDLVLFFVLLILPKIYDPFLNIIDLNLDQKT